MPNGKKPRNHVTMTATTSLWGIFSVINDCKPKTKRNLGIIDGDIKDVESVVKRLTLTLFGVIHISDSGNSREGIFLELTRECFDSNKQNTAKFNFALSTPSTISAVTHSHSPVFFSEDNIALSQLKTGEGNDLILLLLCHQLTSC